MKKKFTALMISSFIVFSITGCNKLDPVASVKADEVNGKTYEQILKQSGRCESPEWMQDTSEIGWQDNTLSETIKVSVICRSKAKVKIEEQFSTDMKMLDVIRSRVINSSEFNEAKARYEEMMSEKSPPYDENKMKKLARELCKFPDVSQFSEFVNALRMPGDYCQPSNEQIAKLKDEFALRNGVIGPYILLPFFKDHAIKLAKNTQLSNKAETSETLDIEEKIIFNVQYLKTGGPGRRMRNSKYEANVGTHYYELKVNGVTKMQRSYPSVSQIFTSPLVF